MKSKFLTGLSILIILIFNNSCAQNSDSNKSKAQSLINEAGSFMMNKNPGIKGKEALREATKLLEESILIDSSLNIAYSSLTTCYLQLGKPLKAIEVCSKWLNMNPKDYHIRLTRGMLYYRTNNLALSEADFSFVKTTIAKDTVAIKNTLKKNEIEGIINTAYVNLVVGQRDRGLYLLKQLSNIFPHSDAVLQANRKFQELSREGLIKQLTGYY